MSFLMLLMKKKVAFTFCLRLIVLPSCKSESSCHILNIEKKKKRLRVKMLPLEIFIIKLGRGKSNKQLWFTVAVTLITFLILLMYSKPK